MSKENKTSYVLAIGSRAYSFHDQSTGITICKGEEKELSPRQFRTKKIQKAIASGHLVIVANQSNIGKYTDEDIEKLNKKLITQITKGMEVTKMSKAYSLEEMKLIAVKHDIEADSEDTIESLIQAILEDVEENKK